MGRMFQNSNTDSLRETPVESAAQKLLLALRNELGAELYFKVAPHKPRLRERFEITLGKLVEHEVRKRFDLVAHLERQRGFSERTFGPGARTAGVLDHIRKELKEIEQDPLELEEWVDVILLALDGAWRAGHEPAAIARGIDAKMTKNEQRDWPDWRTAPEGRAIEHVRGEEPAALDADGTDGTDIRG